MRYTKMQGAGNDFLVLNNRALRLTPAQLSAMAAHLCRHRLSVGGDALMAVDFPQEGGDFRMRFYNADGTEAEMCGNGARCIARYAYENGIAGEQMTIETLAGPVQAWRQGRRRYRIRLNDPSVLDLIRPVEIQGQPYDCAYLELGNPGIPHAVVHCQGLGGKSLEELRELGRALRYHPAFPKGANVNFYDVTADNEVVERTYERGVEDFTLACGTGSGSTAAVLCLLGRVSGPTVHLSVPGGDLWIEVERRGETVTGLYLIGDTNFVSEGEILDEDLVLKP